MNPLSVAIRDRLAERNLTQSALAARVQRPATRISEFLRSLDQARPMKDRLTLLQEIADALQLEIVLTPREKADAVAKVLGPDRHARMTLAPASTPNVFDELFIDLGDEDAPTRDAG